MAWSDAARAAAAEMRRAHAHAHLKKSGVHGAAAMRRAISYAQQALHSSLRMNELRAVQAFSPKVLRSFAKKR